MSNPTGGSAASFSFLLRQGHRRQSAVRAELRERFSVELEQLLLSNEDEIEDLAQRPNFWDDFFLLRVNDTFVATLVNSLTLESLLDRKANLQNVVFNCLNTMKEGSDKRKLNAGQLLCALLRQIFAKKGWPNFNFDVVNLICGLDKAPIVLEDVVVRIQEFLRSGNEKLIVCGLHLTVAFVTATDNVNGNILNEHFVRESLFMALTQIVRTFKDFEIVQTALLLISILSNYRKYEVADNAFRRCLAAVDDTATLMPIIRLFAERSRKCRDLYTLHDAKPVLKGVHGVLSYIWNWNSPESTGGVEAAEHSVQALPPSEASFLLIVYDLLHENRTFLAICRAETSDSCLQSTSTADLSLPTPGLLSRSTSSIDRKHDDEATQTSQDPALVSFLSFASYLVQHSSAARALIYSRLVLLILNVLTEESGIMGTLCDIDAKTNVTLCYQRPPALPRVNKPRPLICAVLDILMSFMSHNLRKRLHADMYCLCLSAFHRVLCHLAKFRIRVEYHWAETWRVLDTSAQFVCANAAVIPHRVQVAEMISWTFVIWNFFVSYGDTFLADAAALDSFYYEIIRNRATVARCEELLESSGFAPAPILGSLASGGQAQTGQQANIRKVIDYFVDKVETYQKERKIVCFTADQVLDLIKSNNESLELCLPHPNLHIPTRYSEVPAQVAYSRQLLRVVASDLKCKDLGVDARSDVDVLSVS